MSRAEVAIVRDWVVEAREEVAHVWPEVAEVRTEDADVRTSVVRSAPTRDEPPPFLSPALFD